MKSGKGGSYSTISDCITPKLNVFIPYFAFNVYDGVPSVGSTVTVTFLTSLYWILVIGEFILNFGSSEMFCKFKYSLANPNVIPAYPLGSVIKFEYLPKSANTFCCDPKKLV